MYRVIIIASVVLTLFPVVGYMQKKELDEEAYRSWRRVDDYQLSDHGGWIKYRYIFYDNDSANAFARNTYYFYEMKTGRTRILRDIDSPVFFAKGDWIAFCKVKKEGGGDGERVAYRLKDGYEIAIPADAELNDSYPQIAYQRGDRLIVLNVMRRDSVVLHGVFQYYLYGKKWNVIYTSKEEQGHVLRNRIVENGVEDVIYVDKTKSLESFYFYERVGEGSFFVGADINCEEKLDYYYFSLTDKKASKLLSAEQMEQFHIDRYSMRLLDGEKQLLYRQQEGKVVRSDVQDEKDESFQLELWSWNDLVIPSEQAKSGLRRSRYLPTLYLLDLDSKECHKVCEENHSELYIAEGEHPVFAYEKDERPYSHQRDWMHDQRFDLYLVDLKNGKHELLEKELTQAVHWSPKGDYLLYFDNKSRSWVSVNPRSMERNVLSDIISYPLYDEWYDRPNPPAPYGVAGWTRDGRNAIIYDCFDIWVINLSEIEKSYCWTKNKGRENSTVLRLVDPGRNGVRIDLTQDQQVVTFDRRSKSTGLSKLSSQGRLTPLVQENVAFSVLQKTKDGRVILCMKQSYQEDRNLWVCNGQGCGMKKITEVNPQQKQYNWGTAQVVEWMNDKGENNQGLLYLPENYDKNKSYPTIVSFYETHSSDLHVHPVPGLSQAMIDIPTYVSKGYIVFQPDVYIEIGKPGESAYDAVVSGIRSLIDRGIVDSSRIGLQGHSWSGFLAAYLVTRTDIFKCVNIGAATVNLTSVYTAIREGSGQPNMFMFEDWQCRMGATLWDDLDSYIANSPLLFADRIHTPALIFHCDQDEAVSFYDGRNLFLALRRLQRPVWMLNYMGQGHFLTSRPAQVDWTIRLQQFFDHYLKSAPMPRWMKEGININERGVDQKYDSVE